MKAKSRLKRPVETQLPPAETQRSLPIVQDKSPTRIHAPLPTPAKVARQPLPIAAPKFQLQINWKRYLRYLPTLVMSLPFYLGTFYLVTRVYPSKVRDFALPNTYFAFHLALFIANFLGLSFLFLHSRRGFLAALFIQVLIFLKLQSFTVPWYIVIGLIVAFAIIELLLTGIEKLGHQGSATPTHRPRTISHRS